MIIPLFLIPVFIGTFAQFLKRFFNKRYLSEITVSGIHMPRYGGMPSAHTAFVLSLLTTVALTDGVYSSLFAVTTAMTIFILDDALRMRIFLGRHGQALRHLIQKLPKTAQKDFPMLETRLGHTLPEVITGGAVGVFGTLILFYILSRFGVIA